MKIDVKTKAKTKDTLSHEWFTIVSKNPLIKFDGKSQYEVIIKKL